jgi:hypothetical protein
MDWLFRFPSEVVPVFVRGGREAVVVVRGLVVAEAVRLLLEVLRAADVLLKISSIPTKLFGLPPPINPPCADRFSTPWNEDSPIPVFPVLVAPPPCANNDAGKITSAKNKTIPKIRIHTSDDSHRLLSLSV